MGEEEFIRNFMVIMLIVIVIIWSILAMRRANDLNMRYYWLLIAAIPTVGLLLVFYLLFAPGRLWKDRKTGGHSG